MKITHNVPPEELAKLRLTPSYARQNVRSHIERVNRFKGESRARVGLCGCDMKPQTKEVALSALMIGSHLAPP